ncbi:hypothetical protein BVY04_04595 [bacterium M21]|nr:hypothetical protein BVY04_04595 [bacterium M21]
MIITYCQAGLLDKAVVFLDELRTMVGITDRDEVKQLFAKGVFNVTVGYCNTGFPHKAAALWGELRSMADIIKEGISPIGCYVARFSG